jgi:hypothetical protein
MSKRIIYETSRPLTPEERADVIDGAAELIGDDDFEFVDYAPDPRIAYSPEDLYISMAKHSSEATVEDVVDVYMKLHPDADREVVTAEVSATATFSRASTAK